MGPWQILAEAFLPGDEDPDDLLAYQSDPLKRGFQGATTAVAPKPQDVTSAVPAGAGKELRGVRGAGPGKVQPAPQRSGPPSGWEWLKQNDPEFGKKKAPAPPGAKSPAQRPSVIPMAKQAVTPGPSGPREPGSAAQRPPSTSPVPTGAGRGDKGDAVAAPKHAGTFVGQRWTAAGPIVPGRLPIDKREKGARQGPAGKDDTAWMPISKHTKQEYVWDGSAWVSPEVFSQKFPKAKR